MKSFFTSVLVFLAACALAAPAWAFANRDPRVYEMRIYHAAPGKLEALHARFRDHTMKLFERHGIQNIGYWVPIENSDNKLIYVLAYPSREARERSWKDFMADADWQKAWKESEANGKLVNKVESFFLTATDYSPRIKAPENQSPRIFELRTYTAGPGRLGDLDARFRSQTIKIFKRHGMRNVAYWHLMPDQKGADNTLIYILSHKNKEAAAKSWDAFRNDPKWQKAKKESEDKAGGPLTITDGVKSVYMVPTDYSPVR